MERENGIHKRRGMGYRYLFGGDGRDDEGFLHTYGGRECWMLCDWPFGFRQKGSRFQRTRQIVDRISVYTACMVIILIIGSTIFGHFIAVTKIPLIAADWIMQLPFNRYIILILIGLIYLLGGSFIDDMAFMILATPIFYPVVVKLGFDLIWFGMFLQITVMIGVIIPPMAINVFVVNNITKVPAWEIYCGVIPFLLSLVFVVLLIDPISPNGSFYTFPDKDVTG